MALVVSGLVYSDLQGEVSICYVMCTIAANPLHQHVWQPCLLQP